MSQAWFVDCHSHVVPSGDDGAKSVAEGRALCVEASRHGTRLLFATPHVWPHLVLTADREHEIRRNHARVAAHAALELRLGFELSPTDALLDDDPARYVLDGTDRVLMEVPFVGALDIVFALAEHIEAAGLRPVIAHPERSLSVIEQPVLAELLADHGWTLQVNASSLLGYHGRHEHDVGWQLVELGLAELVASDGHRTARPPQLDDAYDAVRARIGKERAERLFDGSALGLGRVPAERAA